MLDLPVQRQVGDAPKAWRLSFPVDLPRIAAARSGATQAIHKEPQIAAEFGDADSRSKQIVAHSGVLGGATGK